jgi:Sulfotransferase family
MIISHKYRYIFFAVPKTGTHSVRQALRPYMDAADQEQVGLFVRKSFDTPELANIGHGHLSVQQVESVLGEVFRDYFKFAFVRNPYDRFVSFCAFMTREGGQFHENPRAVMRLFIRDRPPVEHILFRPQHELLCDVQGRLAMDFVGRSERTQADYEQICARLGFPAETLGKVNSSTHRDYRDYYDDELRDRVGAYYARDLELFGYDFDGYKD